MYYTEPVNYRKLQSGDVVRVRVGGVYYDTIIDKQGVQRFHQNDVVRYLQDTEQLNLNQLALAYRIGKFSRRCYAEFMMSLGYSVSGFCELHAFQAMEIENPVWQPIVDTTVPKVYNLGHGC